MRELPDGMAGGEGEVGRPGVDGVDRPARGDPLADGAAPGALAEAVVPLGDVDSPSGRASGRWRPRRPPPKAASGRPRRAEATAARAVASPGRSAGSRSAGNRRPPRPGRSPPGPGRGPAQATATASRQGQEPRGRRGQATADRPSAVAARGGRRPPGRPARASGRPRPGRGSTCRPAGTPRPTWSQPSTSARPAADHPSRTDPPAGQGGEGAPGQAQRDDPERPASTPTSASRAGPGPRPTPRPARRSGPRPTRPRPPRAAARARRTESDAPGRPMTTVARTISTTGRPARREEGQARPEPRDEVGAPAQDPVERRHGRQPGDQVEPGPRRAIDQGHAAEEAEPDQHAGPRPEHARQPAGPGSGRSGPPRSPRASGPRPSSAIPPRPTPRAWLGATSPARATAPSRRRPGRTARSPRRPPARAATRSAPRSRLPPPTRTKPDARATNATQRQRAGRDPVLLRPIGPEPRERSRDRDGFNGHASSSLPGSAPSLAEGGCGRGRSRARRGPGGAST